MSTMRQRLGAALRPEADDAPMVEQAAGLTLTQVARRFAPRLKPLKWWIVLSLGLLGLTPLLEVAEIWLFEKLVDDVLVPANWEPLLVFAVIFVGLNLLSAVISGLDDYVTTFVSGRFLLSLRTDTFRHVLALPLHVHERRRLGDVMSRLTDDVGEVEDFMIGQFAGAVDAVVRLVVFGTALVVMQWNLALASFIVIPLFWWIAQSFSRYVRRLSRERRRRGGSLAAVTEEHLASGALVQSYNREADALTAYHRQNRAIFRAELASSRVRALFLPLADLTELLGTLVVLGLGVWAMQEGQLTLGGLLAFLTLLMQCYKPVRDLADMVPDLYSATAGIERLVELLDEDVPQDRPGAVELRDPKGYVVLAGVAARYPGHDRLALQQVTLDVSPGEIVALTGPSGAGKSTVARLLTRHLEPEAGDVRLDGRPVDAYTMASLREAVTVVLQEAMLLDASVAENISYARPDAGPEEIRAAARAADADGFIQALPQGYATRVGQRGRSLSGGQRQRIALARALLRDSPVLVLDEPTTGLDPASARRVLAPLREAARQRAVLLVTHDPVAQDFADRIVWLEDGRSTSLPENPASEESHVSS